MHDLSCVDLETAVTHLVGCTAKLAILSGGTTVFDVVLGAISSL